MKPTNKSEIFLSVIQAHKGIVYKISSAYCKNTEDRKDLVQEIMVQLWKAFDNYDNDYKYSTWIYRISLNVAISFYRKEKTRNKISSSLNEEILEFTDANIYEEKEADLNILQQAISQLRDLDKALILLYLEEKSHKEIAQIIGISQTNVATKIGRIKNVLKENITQLTKQ